MVWVTGFFRWIWDHGIEPRDSHGDEICSPWKKTHENFPYGIHGTGIIYLHFSHKNQPTFHVAIIYHTYMDPYGLWEHVFVLFFQASNNKRIFSLYQIAKEQWVNCRIASSTFPLPAIHNTGSSTRSLGKKEGEFNPPWPPVTTGMRFLKKNVLLLFWWSFFLGDTTCYILFLGWWICWNSWRNFWKHFLEIDQYTIAFPIEKQLTIPKDQYPSLE